MTADDPLAEIRAAREGITRGEGWFWQGVGEHGYPQHILTNSDGLVLIAETFDGDVDRPSPHATWIAASPRYVDTLLARVEELERVADNLRFLCGCWCPNPADCHDVPCPIADLVRPE